MTNDINGHGQGVVRNITKDVDGWGGRRIITRYVDGRREEDVT